MKAPVTGKSAHPDRHAESFQCEGDILTAKASWHHAKRIALYLPALKWYAGKSGRVFHED